MLASELIEMLGELIEESGDLPVYIPMEADEYAEAFKLTVGKAVTDDESTPAIFIDYEPEDAE